MTRSLNLRRSLALTAALVVTTWGAVALPATADTGSGRSADHARSEGPDGRSMAPGQSKDKTKDKTGGESAGDPAGNNGTVKIATLGDLDTIPDNTPLPGCGLRVEWYGFDQGDDIVSTVTFAMQAPTDDVALSVDGPTSVPVGGDPASGAGTDSGIDGTETYTLSFDGAPQEQQGYHVKLTVATPRSHGNDTKTKVFWFAPCETETAGTASTATGSDTSSGGETAQSGATVTQEGAAIEESTATAAGEDILVMGAQASAGGDTEVSAAEASAADARVPTVIDAGQQSALDWVTSPLSLLVIALGAALTTIAVAARRRSSVRPGE